MRFLIVPLTAIFLIFACQPASSKVEINSANQDNANFATNETSADVSSIRKVDFQNFTFPWTKKFGFGEKSYALKNGTAKLSDGRELSLMSLSYIDVVDDIGDQAIVVIDEDDGNATYTMLYVYAIEKNKPKLLESFEFGEDIHYGTAFVAHSELVIERYVQKAGDAECCPSIIEISYYKWQKDKFVLQGEPQQVPNGYVERVKKKK